MHNQHNLSHNNNGQYNHNIGKHGHDTGHYNGKHDHNIGKHDHNIGNHGHDAGHHAHGAWQQESQREIHVSAPIDAIPAPTEAEIKRNNAYISQKEAIAVRTLNEMRAALCAHAANRSHLTAQDLFEDLMPVLNKIETLELGLFSAHLDRNQTS